MTEVGVLPPLAGAEMMTSLAPAVRCLPASSWVRKTPVDSITASGWYFPQGNFSGSRCARMGMSFLPRIKYPIRGSSSVALSGGLTSR